MEFLKVVNNSQLVRTTDVVRIDDDKLNAKWFIEIERMDGKFVSIREMMNPDFFNSKSLKYRNIVYNLAYNHITENKNKS